MFKRFLSRRPQAVEPELPILDRLFAFRQEDLRLANARLGTTMPKEWDRLRDSAIKLLFEIYDGALPELHEELHAEVAKWRSHRLCNLSERSWSNDWAVILTRELAVSLGADGPEAAHAYWTEDDASLASQKMRIYVSHAAPGFDPNEPPKDWFVVQPMDAPEEQVESLIRARRTVVAFDVDPYQGKLIEVGPVESV